MCIILRDSETLYEYSEFPYKILDTNLNLGTDGQDLAVVLRFDDNRKRHLELLQDLNVTTDLKKGNQLVPLEEKGDMSVLKRAFVLADEAWGSDDEKDLVPIRSAPTTAKKKFIFLVEEEENDEKEKTSSLSKKKLVLDDSFNDTDQDGRGPRMILDDDIDGVEGSKARVRPTIMLHDPLDVPKDLDVPSDKHKRSKSIILLEDDLADLDGTDNLMVTDPNRKEKKGHKRNRSFVVLHDDDDFSTVSDEDSTSKKKSGLILLDDDDDDLNLTSKRKTKDPKSSKLRKTVITLHDDHHDEEDTDEKSSDSHSSSRLNLTLDTGENDDMKKSLIKLESMSPLNNSYGAQKRNKTILRLHDNSDDEQKKSPLIRLQTLDASNKKTNNVPPKKAMIRLESEAPEESNIVIDEDMPSKPDPSAPNSLEAFFANQLSPIQRKLLPDSETSDVSFESSFDHKFNKEDSMLPTLAEMTMQKRDKRRQKLAEKRKGKFNDIDSNATLEVQLSNESVDHKFDKEVGMMPTLAELSLSKGKSKRSKNDKDVVADNTLSPPSQSKSRLTLSDEDNEDIEVKHMSPSSPSRTRIQLGDKSPILSPRQMKKLKSPEDNTRTIELQGEILSSPLPITNESVIPNMSQRETKLNVITEEDESENRYSPSISRNDSYDSSGESTIKKNTITLTEHDNLNVNQSKHKRQNSQVVFSDKVNNVTNSIVLLSDDDDDSYEQKQMEEKSSTRKQMIVLDDDDEDDKATVFQNKLTEAMKEKGLITLEDDDQDTSSKSSSSSPLINKSKFVLED